jgi:hypothetical protein
LLCDLFAFLREDFMKNIQRLSIAAGFALASVAAVAAPIQYEVTTIGSGSLNGVAFSSKKVTITATADTASITTEGQTLYVPVLSSTLLIDGFEATTFVGTHRVFNNKTVAIAGFQRGPTDARDILDVRNSAFSSYNLSTSIGPLAGSTLGNGGALFTTAAGNFALTSFGSGTFTAAAVPEPATMATLAIGAALVARRRRRS